MSKPNLGSFAEVSLVFFGARPLHCESFGEANLAAVDLKDAKGQSVGQKWSANLTEAVLVDAKLNHANLQDANTLDCDFTGADLTGTVLDLAAEELAQA